MTKRGESASLVSVCIALLSVAIVLAIILSGNWITVGHVVNPGDNITACDVLSQSGNYYMNASILASAAATCVDITISNVFLDCGGYTIDGTDGASTNGIRSAGLSNLTIVNCTLTDWEDGIELGNTANITVRNVTASSNVNGLYIFRVGGTDPTRHVVLENLTANSNSYGIRLEATENITIANSTVSSNTNYGIYAFAVNNTTVFNSTILYSGLSGIAIFGNITNITNNTMNGNRYGINISTIAETNASIQMNFIKNNTRGGILVYGYNHSILNNTILSNLWDGIEAYINTSFVANNTINSNSYSGIFLNSSHNTTIQNNTLGSNSVNGLNATNSRNNTIRGNVVRSNSNDGLSLNFSSNNSMEGNMVFSGGNAGIYIVRNSTNNTIINNSIDLNSQNGIYISGNSTNNSIINTLLRQNSVDAIRIDSTSNYTNITGNFISGNNRGIYILNSGGARLHNNTMTGDSTGMLIQNSGGLNMTNNSISSLNAGFDVRGNVVADFDNWIDNSSTIGNKPIYYWVRQYNQTMGSETNAAYIAVVSSSNITVRDLNPRSNAQGIILVNSSDSAVNNTNVSAASQYGIYLLLSNNNIIANSSSSWNDAGSVGIYIQNSTNNTIRNITANFNPSGIELDRSDNNTIENITSSSNTGSALQFTSSYNNTISNSTFNSNAGHGLVFTAAKNNTVRAVIARLNTFQGILLQTNGDGNFITNNTLSVNTQNGIYVSQSNNNTIEHNILSSNNQSGIFITGVNGVNLNSINNSFRFNTIEYNLNDGIYLEVASDNNSFSSNIVSHSLLSGINLSQSSNNTFHNTTLSNNTFWDFFSSSTSVNNSATSMLGSTNLSFSGRDVSLKSASSPASAPSGYTALGKYANLSNTTTSSWAILNFSYVDSDVSGLTEGSGIIARYTESAWGTNVSAFSSGVTISAANNYLYANVTNFSIFGAFAPPTPSSPQSTPSSGGGGGGGGGYTPSYQLIVKASETSFKLEKNESKTIRVVLENNGTDSLTGIIVRLIGISNASYRIDGLPDYLNAKKSIEFTITFTSAEEAYKINRLFVNSSQGIYAEIPLTITPDGATTTTTKPKQCPVCPDPSQYGACSNFKQSRTVYKCGPDTDYVCKAEVEEAVCIPLTPEQKKSVAVIAILAIFSAVILFKLKVHAVSSLVK